MTTPVVVTSEFPIPAERVAELVAKPALMRHVLWPVITFSEMPERFGLDEPVVVHLRLVGVLPLWRHTVRVVHLDPENLVAVTDEHGGPLRGWRHRLSAVSVDEGRCRYTDEVEIDAGRLTTVSRVVARLLYRYRHRRWAALARVLA